MVGVVAASRYRYPYPMKLLEGIGRPEDDVATSEDPIWQRPRLFTTSSADSISLSRRPTI